MDKIDDITARAAQIDLEAFVIAGEYDPNEPVDPSHNDESLSEAIIEIFGRTGATSITRIELPLAASLMNGGLIRAVPERTRDGRRVRLNLTEAGHAVRTARILRDLDLSNRVMAELGRRARRMDGTEYMVPAGLQGAFHTVLPKDPRVARTLFRRAARLMLAYQEAEREDRLDDFLAMHHDAFAAMDDEQISCIDTIGGGAALTRVIRGIKEMVAERFMRGDGGQV